MSEKKSLPEKLDGVHIHFVGIKGTGMAALVEILFHNGAIITGSDVSERFYTDEILEKLGLSALPFSEKNITDKIDYVVYSSAYKLDKNPDLIAAVKKNIPCLLYTEALGSYSSRAYSCGICGVHGKTSTTGLVGTILKELDLPSQVLAGSIINSFGNTCTYTSPILKNKAENTKEKQIFVAETCEYQRHFMSFCPQKIILTSVEPDHQDYYPTYEDIRDAFVDYICKLPENGELIYCADDKGAVETANLAKSKRKDIVLIPYGEKACGDFKLVFEGVKNELNLFSVDLFNSEKEKFSFGIKIPGKHEVMDACAALALVCLLLKEFNKNPLDYKNQIKKGLENFCGGKRRSEVVGNKKNINDSPVLIMDDYGHHPTAVKTTLEGFREFYKGRKIIVDFMSHTYSRTQALLDEFSKCFDCVDMLILHKIYSSARENPDDFDITGKTLYEKVKEHLSQKNSKNEQSNLKSENVFYFEEILDAKDFVVAKLNEPLSSEYPDGYLFVTMGAGDNWKIGKVVLEEKND
ncbi:MAG: UDP-N-acetylmuramate--L-alanine ligase [Treponema sp.]|nr:UDP-N-acetylmuramate--L-alanine ligase [Treponema sp.]